MAASEHTDASSTVGGAPTEYRINAHAKSGGAAAVKAAETQIELDAGWGQAPSGLPGPAQLLAAAFAACLLKNLARAGDLLGFGSHDTPSPENPTLNRADTGAAGRRTAALSAVQGSGRSPSLDARSTDAGEHREPAPLSSRQLHRVPVLEACVDCPEQAVVLAVVPVAARASQQGDRARTEMSTLVSGSP